MIRGFIGAWNWLLSAGFWASAIIILVTAVSVNYEVAARYLFGRPTVWVVSFSEYALLYITFLGAAFVLARERHVNIDMLLNSVSPKGRCALNTVASLVGAVACAILFWYSLQITLDAFERNRLLIGPITVPYGFILAVIPLGSFLLVCQFFRRVWFYGTKLLSIT